MAIRIVDKSVEEAGLFVGDAELAVDGGEDALHLSESEHAAEEGIAGVVAMARLVHDASRLIGEGHAVVDTHGKVGVLLLEDAAQLNQVGTSTQMTSFCEVAIGEDVA